MRIKHIYLLLFLFFFSSFGLSAQVQEKEPLTQVLSKIEDVFKCSFSYNDELLAHHFITYNKVATLEEAIKYLERESLFDFTKVSTKNIAVSLKENVQQYCAEFLATTQKKKLVGVQINTPFQKLFTDANGKVQFILPSNTATLAVGGTKFPVKEISAVNLTTTNCNTIAVNAEIELLNPVLLTQYITQGIEKDSDGTISIETEDFVVLPGLIEKDVLFTIQALPGIQSVNENVSYLNIRGGTNDQNLMRWDGIKIYQNGHFFGLISAFNPNLTHQVKVTRNGTRAALGDGVSGTIELYTNTKVNTNFHSEVGINMISADALVDVPISTTASVRVAGRKSLNNIWSSPTYDAYSEKAFQNTEIAQNIQAGQTDDFDFSFYDVGTRFLWTPSKKDKVRLNLLSYENELSFSEENPTQFNSSSLNSGLTQQSLIGGLSYLRQWNDVFSTVFQTSITYNQLGATNADLANDQTLLQQNTIEEGNLFFEASYQFYKNAALKIGYDFVETGITNLEQLDNPLFFQEQKNVMRRNSAFASVQYVSANNKTTIDVGLRANHYDKFNTTLIEPRLSLSHRFLDYFSVEVLGELKSQNTSQIIDLQKDFLGVENRRWLLSSPGDIPLLESQQTSIGFSYTRKRLLINVEPYLKKVVGITAQSQGFQNQFENVRDTGSYTVKGVDVLLNKSFKKVTAWLSYSYADNRYTFDNLQPSEFHNNLDITHTLNLGANYKWQQFDFSAGVNWHTGKPFTQPIASNPLVDNSINYGFPNEVRIKDYVRVDTSILYNFNISEKIKAMAGISFWNLMDRENHIRSFFTIDEEDQVMQINDRALPFTPNAAFRVFF